MKNAVMWRLFKLWQRVGIKFFKYPMVLEYNAGGRVIGITFSASLEHAQALKDFWERKDHFAGLDKELKAAHEQIVELEDNIKPPAAK